MIAFDDEAAPGLLQCIKAMRVSDYDAMLGGLAGNTTKEQHEKNLRALSTQIVAHPAFALAILESLELVEISTIQHFRRFAEKMVREKKQESLLDQIKRETTNRLKGNS